MTNEIPAPPPSGAEDALAKEESVFLANKPDPPALIAARHKYHLEIWAIKSAFMTAIRKVVFVLPFLGLIMIGVWLWHIIMPPNWRWLSAEEVNHLQALIFSGAISALATAIATKVV